MMKIVYVRWLDARGCSGAQNLSTVARIEGLVMHSAGILVRDDAKVLTIAQDSYSYDDVDRVRESLIIPAKQVIDKQIIEINDIAPEP